MNFNYAYPLAEINPFYFDKQGNTKPLKTVEAYAQTASRVVKFPVQVFRVIQIITDVPICINEITNNIDYLMLY